MNGARPGAVFLCNTNFKILASQLRSVCVTATPHDSKIC